MKMLQSRARRHTITTSVHAQDLPATSFRRDVRLLLSPCHHTSTTSLPTMTAIKTNAPSLLSNKAAPPLRKDDARTASSSRKAAVLRPSATEEDAKSRFVSALANGVEALLERGHGRERASAELLSEIADGCSPPDEDEVGKIMLIF